MFKFHLKFWSERLSFSLHSYFRTILITIFIIFDTYSELIQKENDVVSPWCSETFYNNVFLWIK